MSREKQMPCEITPAIFIVLIRKLFFLRKSNSGLSGNTESISTYTHLSPTLNSSFFTITLQPSMIAKTILSRPSIGIISETVFILANFLISISPYKKCLISHFLKNGSNHTYNVFKFIFATTFQC